MTRNILFASAFSLIPSTEVIFFGASAARLRCAATSANALAKSIFLVMSYLGQSDGQDSSFLRTELRLCPKLCLPTLSEPVWKIHIHFHYWLLRLPTR